MNSVSKVSYHLDVHRDGKVTRFVPDKRRAWAVGVGEWTDISGKIWRNLNSISLSASFANKNDKKEHLTEIQIATMKEIVLMWRAEHPTIQGIVTHAEVARPVGRKMDPIGAPNFRLQDYL